MFLRDVGHTSVNNFLHASAGTRNIDCPVFVLCRYVHIGGPHNMLLRPDPGGVGVLLQLSQEVRAPSCVLRKQGVLHMQSLH